jgi:hypothetical protein
MFVMAGLLLHWRPKRFLAAVTKAVPATAGVLIQFPLYGAIFDTGHRCNRSFAAGLSNSMPALVVNFGYKFVRRGDDHGAGLEGFTRSPGHAIRPTGRRSSVPASRRAP